MFVLLKPDLICDTFETLVSRREDVTSRYFFHGGAAFMIAMLYGLHFHWVILDAVVKMIIADIHGLF